MIRIPLKNRVLPNYTRGQEIANMVTHILGACYGMAVLIACVWFSAQNKNYTALFSGCVFGIVMIAMYAISSVYHGLIPCMGKKVMQVLDHCSIYCLIAATYTPITLVKIYATYPLYGIAIFILEWAIAGVCIVFSAIDLKRFKILEMTSYIVMGWMVVFFGKGVLDAIGWDLMKWILSGGIVFTIGAVIYNLGKKNQMYHTIFHVFCLMGSALQSVAVIKICAM